MNSKDTALIVIDSGFSLESIRRAGRIIAVYDVPTGKVMVGTPNLAAKQLTHFAYDPMNHGSIVLDRLTELIPEAPVILVRAFGSDNSVIRTRWESAAISHNGWTEAYRWAVAHCRKLGLRSVANCSFGGFVHAMDGTGWEAFQLAHETGAGKPNHIVVAGAGPGDARANHAAWQHLPCERVVVNASQTEDTRYNFWAGAPASQSDCGAAAADWKLTVLRDGEVVHECDGRKLWKNFWNNRQQLTFTVRGSGHVQLIMERASGPGTACGDSRCAQRFDVWVNGGASFLDHVDATLVAEPAVFPHVIAAGLRSGNYAPDQMQPGTKPDVLLSGAGPISFRLPEVTAAVARLLMSSEAGFDVEQVRALLGKFPDCESLARWGVRA